MRKRFGAIMAAAALVLTACIAPGPSHERGSVEFITIAAGGTSGPYYQIGASMAQIFRNELGSDASVQATGASVENISLITSGRAELAFVMGDATRQAVEGTGPFEGRRQLSELTALTALYPNYVQIVTTARTGIRSVEDLRGKRVGVGDKNSGVELNAQMILDAYGMTYDDIQEDFLSYSGAIDQIKNGQTDAAFVTSGLPNSSIMDLATTEDVVIVPIEGEGFARLKEKYPFFDQSAIPGGTYSQAEDVLTASIMNQLLVSPDLDEEQVYKMTKALFENLDTLHASHKAATGITLDSFDEGAAVPIHPGALRYYTEQGAVSKDASKDTAQSE
ncbi:MAG: TAXI family TRAP transporter solute-binding subunit [Actinomyces sp.]|uniref:TAXI family TRAP transporter solute-binding subunit n=1 Tax=Actinomyces ihuae TaxID=1673722 RepID=UPI00071D95CE|nr:TAXI family TRAP transporter solute-binding subunit [Actinomyces ihuae]MDU5005400.1 TAXI family TRAP transporter solute-binding subunit [Actinomyces sp.]MDU7730609.1 TAXI family TRAP transporter solute-binding subunit [Actinomyces sp.]